MATTKKRSTKYSRQLDSMTVCIKRFLDTQSNEEIFSRIQKGVQDFCYKYPPVFTNTFLKQIGLSKFKHFPSGTPDEKLVSAFVNHIAKNRAEGVFLLVDTYDVREQYQSKTGRGFGLIANRKFICGNNEERYFKLIDLVYHSMSDSSDVSTFLSVYFKKFNKLMQRDKFLLGRAKQITEYVLCSKSRKNIVFVDTGFQFTLSLFCWAAVKKFARGELIPDFYALTAYPWLQDFFRGKYFSEKSEDGEDIEFAAIKHYYVDMKSRAAGVLVGFAVGDALGFPVAGIDRKDIKKLMKSETGSFRTSPQHPFFSHLRPAQYTDNTNSLMISAENIIDNNGFEVKSYIRSLIIWGRKIVGNPRRERWVGPTLLSSIKKLIDGKSYRRSGSTTTKSCSSAYRAVPVGIFYRDNIKLLKKSAEISGMISHNSDISKTGTVITALIIAYLLNGHTPDRAVRAAINSVKKTNKNKILLDRLSEAIKFSRNKSVAYARKYFGTGSPIYQTLPLAVYCFLKYSDNFEKAVSTAANSYRDDSPQEKKRLRGLSWKQRVLNSWGGNTDGIAGLVGAFCGTHLGITEIPKKFLGVENSAKLIKLGRLLIRD